MHYDDGVLTLHQSDISHYMNCPEQFRVVNGLGGGKLPDPDHESLRVETDAATVGTVLHSVIERDLGEPYKSVSSAQKAARKILGNLVESYILNGIEYRTESFGSDPGKCLKALDLLVESWMTSEEREYWQHRDTGSYELEKYFEVPFLQRESDVISSVKLAGTMDVFDVGQHRVVDWKSSGRAYERWEKQRWAIQPTVYTYAASVLGIQPNEDGLYQFDYRVFVRRGVQEAQSVTVWRGNGQHTWLVNIVENICKMIESPLLMWPLRDDHALCSPKWCPIWNDCKGMWVDTENNAWV